MKRRTSFLLISVIALALVGCGVTSADSVSAAATTSATEVVADKAEAMNATKATTVNENSSDEIPVKPEKITNSEDASFEYNGNTVSILDDTKTVLAALGTPTSSEPSAYNNSETYLFGADPDIIEYSAFKLSNGTEAPDYILVQDKNIKTSKGIGIGNTEKEIISAYGKPSEIADFPEVNIYDLDYDMGSFSITFSLDNDKKLTSFSYLNNDNGNKYSCALN